MIAVLDYGIGNLRSAEKALVALGADARLVTSPHEATGATGVVLPGVGDFGACAVALSQCGLEEVARRAIETGVPFLGICVGFQLLFEASEETDTVPGLGVLEGTVQKIPGSVKLPQMQWNRVEVREGAQMFLGAPQDPYYYFVHSYGVMPFGGIEQVVVGTCDYGGEVVAAVERDNLWGVQFHPEKSGGNGLLLLGHFVERAERSKRSL